MTPSSDAKMNQPEKTPSRLSRRSIVKRSAMAAGAAVLAAQTNRAPAQQTGTMAGRKYRAFVRFNNGAAVEDLTLKAISPRQVVVRTEASQCCYSISGQALGTTPFTPARILGHGGVGIVEAVGSQVHRVQVGDRVIVANTPQCGQCYACLHGRPDRCQMGTFAGEPLAVKANLKDGTPVVEHNNQGGFGELMIPYEEYCIPVFTSVPPVELAMLACVGACGLGTTINIAPVEVASDVCVLGCGPLGLSAIQGARIKGASRIIAVDPVKYRRELALKLGATIALDPNVEGKGLVEKIRELCKGPTDRKLSGGRNWTAANNDRGPDFVIEASGGDQFVPKAEAGPDPTGILQLQQAWDMVSGTGHIVTVSVGQKGNFSVPGGQWSNGHKNHHPGNMAGTHTMRDMPRFVRLIETGQFDAKSLVAATFPLNRTKEAFQVVADRSIIAAVIVFS
jgi:S-(hydroxymethyl)glutathione dehydrogenase/alcohol dehydrogenase